MPKAFPFHIPMFRNTVDDWNPHYPNPADFRFNYFKLLDQARTGTPAIGQAPGTQPRVAVVGAGAAGLTAARELFRAGYRVRVYEASDRIGGRHYTVPVAGQQPQGMEMGAMRFPFFGSPGADNSAFEYFLGTEADVPTTLFPNPGSAAGGTGIYMNQGLGPNGKFEKPTLISWPESSNPNNPPHNPDLAAVYEKVNALITLFTTTVGPLYVTAAWPEVWRQIANCYEQLSVSDLVFTPAITDYQGDGWFGGFGMTAAQAAIFYTIGAGDGSWGAFYAIGAMWFIRCVMFGFNSDLQTVAGIADPGSLPFYGQPVTDSAGAPLPSPLYLGIQSLDEWLLFQVPPGGDASFYQAMHQSDPRAELFVSRGVTAISRMQADLPGGVLLRVSDTAGQEWDCDYVVVTAPIWRSELSVALNGFDADVLPWDVLTARDEQHIISSCKVFFPLTSTYWTESDIPQILVTDTIVQDAYGVQWDAATPGALLASYTWEDDATKLLALTPEQVKGRVLDTLDGITQSTVGAKISDFVDQEGGIVFQWVQQPTYAGCAKLYRQRNWEQNYALLAYNQQYAAASQMYLAGESYSVEGGWTEPALRSALDAVIRLINDSGGTFNNDFQFSDYPRFDVAFTPDLEYPPKLP